MPSSRRLRLAPEADADLADIWQYTAGAWGEEQADAYLDSLRAKLVNLAHLSGMGRRRDDLSPGLRSFPAEQHLVFYHATDDDLIVRRIIHRNRDAQAELGPRSLGPAALPPGPARRPSARSHRRHHRSSRHRPCR